MSRSVVLLTDDSVNLFSDLNLVEVHGICPHKWATESMCAFLERLLGNVTFFWGGDYQSVRFCSPPKLLCLPASGFVTANVTKTSTVPEGPTCIYGVARAGA